MTTKRGVGVHSSYKEQARKGCDVLFCVKIKGRAKLVDDIPLHMSLKIFASPKEFDLDEMKKYVKKHDICSPDPKKLTFKPIIFTAEVSKLDYYMLKIEGLPPKYKEFYEHYAHVGNVYKTFMTHVTIDKMLYEDLKENGVTADDIEFGPLMLEHGANNPVHTFEKPLEKSEPVNRNAEQGTGGKMQLTPNEISDVEDIGMLDGTKVKMIRTRGGFYICVGRPRGKLQEEALAAGSHPAIVKFNLERQHPGYQPNMMKSELLSEHQEVNNHSHFLSESLRKSGHDLYSVQRGGEIEFQFTKHNSKVGSVVGVLERDTLTFKSLDIDKQFSGALAGATSEKALSCGVQKIRIEGK